MCFYRTSLTSSFGRLFRLHSGDTFQALGEIHKMRAKCCTGFKGTLEKQLYPERNLNVLGVAYAVSVVFQWYATHWPL